MLARCFAALVLLASTASAELITSDTTIDANTPRATYTVRSGTLTVDGATTVDIWVEPGGGLDFLAGTSLGQLGAGGQTTISGGEFRGPTGLGGTTDVYGGIFRDQVGFGGGHLTIHAGDFRADILAFDANCCGTIDVLGGTFLSLTSGTVDGYGGAYTFNVRGGNFTDSVSRGFGSDTTINLFGVGFEKTTGFIQIGAPTYPYARVTGYLEDGNWFDFMSLGPFNGRNPIDDSFYVLHETFRTILPGDANDDGSVDLTDLNLVRNNFGSPGEGDIDGSGTVDLEDLNAVRNNFGAFVKRPPTSPVPEPSTVFLAMALVPMCLCTIRQSSRYCHRR